MRNSSLRQGLRLWTALLCLVALGPSVEVSACLQRYKIYDSPPPIALSIAAPTSTIFRACESVPCRAENTNDTIHPDKDCDPDRWRWSNEPGVWHYDTDIFDPLTFTWSISRLTGTGGTGTFSGNPGRTPTWTAPREGGTFNVNCAASDGRTAGDARYDTPGSTSKSVTVVSTDTAAGISGPDVVCAGECATFTAGTVPSNHNDMLTWSGGDAVCEAPSSGNNYAYKIKWTTAGTYYVNVKVAADGCDAATPKQVRVDDCPPVWDADTAIQLGSISSPTAGNGYACNSEVVCHINAASDQDHRYVPATGQHTHPGDTLTYTWSDGGAGGSWKNGISSGVDLTEVTWIAPATPRDSATITCTVNDIGTIPMGEAGDRSDAPVGAPPVYPTRTVTIKVYEIRCCKVEAVDDIDIYWPNEPHTDDKVWAADAATFQTNGTLAEDWHRERIADVFRAPQQHYTLALELFRHPDCVTDQTPSTTVTFNGLTGSQQVWGWTPDVTVNTRNSVGRRSYTLTCAYYVGSQLVGTSQTLPEAPASFIDYAIYAQPCCAEADFTNDHLYSSCFWATGGTDVTADDIPALVQQNIPYNFQENTWEDPWLLENANSPGDCRVHSGLMEAALEVLGIPADGTSTEFDDTWKVGESRHCDVHNVYEWHFFTEAAGSRGETNFEAVCQVYLTDEDTPYYCYFDKAMGDPYQAGTYDDMWTAWNSYPPPNHKVIHHFTHWYNH